MIAEQLRKSILQAAVQGKLTEQLPEDGDARDLLKEIKNEKARLVKEGKIKKEMPLPEITEDEIPFNIPGNWCWVRLGEITDINPRNKIDDETPVSFIPMTLLDEGYSNTFTYEERLWKNVKSGFTHFSDNDIVVAKITPCFQNRKSAVMRELINDYGAGTTELHVIRPISNLVSSNYLLYLFKTEYFICDGVLSMTGTAGQQRVGKTYVQNFICPLPPLEEQKRIVERLISLISEIEELEKDETKLDALQKTFPKKMKDSILQYAIQGKLTDQLESDGDARDLLREIQKEKERLTREGKIKKEKPLPEITDDEIPFDIPENWCWVRLGELASIISKGTTPYGGKTAYKNSGIGFVRGENVGVDGKVKTDTLMFIDINTHLIKLKRSILEDKDLLICIAGTLGRSAVVEANQLPMNTNQAVSFVRLINHERISVYYLQKAVSSFDVQEYLLRQTKVTAIPNLTLEIINNCIIPLPPLAEQQRIVERLNQLLPL